MSKPDNPRRDARPLVLVTGIAGSVGRSLSRALQDKYRVVGMDRSDPEDGSEWIEVDLTSDESVATAVDQLGKRHGRHIASVFHLAAYFDFSGEQATMYEQVNVQGTRRLLDALQALEVDQFVYSGTMLVHEATEPGKRIDEDAPIRPRWAYPESKAAAEGVIAEAHGRIPYVLLHLAGLYDDETAVPTLAHQIARIYERNLQGHLYAGDQDAGQSMLHREDMIDAFVRVLERRADLPGALTILVGEPDAMGYADLQDRIGHLVHGEREWATLSVPAPLAKAGAWMQGAAEPVVPDAIDDGEKPFIRPFMMDISSDHYALDIGRARKYLDWSPRHAIDQGLEKLVASLKRDPPGWYEANGINPPAWLEPVAKQVAQDSDVEQLRRRHEQAFRDAHRRNLWAPFATVGLGVWLFASPQTFGPVEDGLVLSDMLAGAALMALGLATLSWRMAALRWVTGAIGMWVMFAPLLFWTGNAAALANGTLVGALVTAMAMALPPTPGISPAALYSGPDVPPGWDYSPSDWSQRIPILMLAVVGLVVSRYMAAYQLGHVDSVWEPFFDVPGNQNGTESIITSELSEAWPVPDAGVGALVYLLEIIAGLMGSRQRWRTMPWVVVAFGMMIVPLGVVSIAFIIIQPILLGTWCTLCLIGAAAMLLQIPYSLDELVATGQFLRRRRKAGRSVLVVFFTGDTDEGGSPGPQIVEFERPLRVVLRDVFAGNLNVPWNLAACMAIGLWLMLTRLSVGAEGSVANTDHLIGALVLTVSVTALAEVARSVRLLNVPLGVALMVAPFVVGASSVSLWSSVVCGIALVVLSVRRGPIRLSYGRFDRLIV